MGKMVQLTGDEGFALSAYLSPAVGTRKGGLVLAQEIFGVTDHIKELCDGFAADGYDVIAPSLYDRAHRDWRADYSKEGIATSLKLVKATGIKHTAGDIQAAIDYLDGQGNKRIHITGYCYGGAVAWLAACRCSGLTSAVGYYGRLIMDLDTEVPTCPTMLHFGSKDASIPIDWVNEFAKRRQDIAVHVYDADHGFNSDRRDNFNAEVTRQARERTLEWFEKA